MLNTYTTYYLFENRLYISPFSESEIKISIYSENGEEYKGASVRSYSKIVGFVLSLLGISSKLNINDKMFYINNKSFSKFVIRSIKLREVNSIKEAAKEFNNLFIEYNEKGYNEIQVNAINKELKKYLFIQKIMDIYLIMRCLKIIAQKNEYH